MYPVDLLKVRGFRPRPSCSVASALTPEDQNADCQSVTERHVQRYIECHGHNIPRRGLLVIMERLVECCNGRRLVSSRLGCCNSGADRAAGPAHAVYFASYEATKHALGGNEGGSDEHHPFAAGADNSLATWSEVLLTGHSCQRCCSHDFQRRADEPVRW